MEINIVEKYSKVKKVAKESWYAQMGVNMMVFGNKTKNMDKGKIFFNKI